MRGGAHEETDHKKLEMNVFFIGQYIVLHLIDEIALPGSYAERSFTCKEIHFVAKTLARQ